MHAGDTEIVGVMEIMHTIKCEGVGQCQHRNFVVFGLVVAESGIFPRMTQLATAVRRLRGLGTDVLYVDKQLVVLNKRSGVVAQPTRSIDQIDRDSENTVISAASFSAPIASDLLHNCRPPV